MKHILRATLALLLLAGTACQRRTVIPDDELAQIFHDAFLANAYLSNHPVREDSMKLYEPIFARYGYTADDVYYTIGNFSKRKSARLGDVVEEAIALLEREGEHYDREVAILDTVDNVARRTCTRTVFSDSLVRARSAGDTARLRYSFDVRPGDYRIRMRYRVDSADRNAAGSLRSVMWLERRDGRRSNTYYLTLRRTDAEQSFTRILPADTVHRKLRIELLDFSGKRFHTPSVTFRNLTVEHIPTAEEAVDSLYRSQLDIRIFAEEFFRAAAPKDSL